MPPLLLLALGVLAGAAAYPALPGPPGPPIAGCALLTALSLMARSPAVAGLAVTAAGLCLGAALPARLPEPAMVDGPGRARGMVVTAAWGRTADVSLDSWEPLGAEPRPARGRVRVRFPSSPPPPGTPVLLLGEAGPLDPTRLPGEPDPGWEAARARVARLLIARATVAVAPDPTPARVEGARHGGLVRALWNGERAGIPDAEAELLRRTGTWHLVSISGLHIGLAALAGWGLAWVLTRPLALVLPPAVVPWLCAAGAILVAWAYADLAGSVLPAVRALWMSAAGAVAGALRRRPGPWEALALALVGVLWAEPAAVANPGLQLSFGGIAGIVLVAPRVTRWVPPDVPGPLRWVVQALGTSVGATLGTLPVVAWRFQDLSPLSMLANLWAVPWIGTVASPAAVASQVLPGAAGRLALAIADAALAVGLWGLTWVDVEPWHPAVGPAGATALALAPLLRRRVAAWAGLTLLALGLRVGDPTVLTVRFLAIGQGDAAVVEWPDGRVWLVDGGPPGTDLLHYLRRRGVRRLDRVYLSHPHPDHLGGLLPVVAALPVDEVWAPRSPRYGEVDFQTLARGRRLHLPDEALPGLLPHPRAGWRSPARDGVNDESLVLRLREGTHSFLFAGDVERAGEAALVAAGIGQATVLKVPHHGSATSSTAAFVDAVDPDVAVVSCGWDNRYGHPRSEALASYRGRRVYRTDHDGTVVIRTDGDHLTVEREAAPDPVWSGSAP